MSSVDKPINLGVSGQRNAADDEVSWPQRVRELVSSLPVATHTHTHTAVQHTAHSCALHTRWGTTVTSFIYLMTLQWR